MQALVWVLLFLFNSHWDRDLLRKWSLGVVSGETIWWCYSKLLEVGLIPGVQTLLLTCVTLGRSLSLLEPQFCYLFSGARIIPPR